jgi:DUF4097 and DUF4098 domain-containing protein YvlB
LHTDQGKSTDGNLVRQLCDYATDSKDKNNTLSPSSNGQAERYDMMILQTSICSLRVNSTIGTHGYKNCLEQSEQTNRFFSLNMMIFGREVVQPLDVTIGTSKIDPPKKEVSQFIKQLVDNHGKIHETARENLIAKQERQNDLYDF